MGREGGLCCLETMTQKAMVEQPYYYPGAIEYQEITPMLNYRIKIDTSSPILQDDIPACDLYESVVSLQDDKLFLLIGLRMNRRPTISSVLSKA